MKQNPGVIKTVATKSKHYDEMADSIRQMRAIERGELRAERRYTAVDILGPERAALLEARQRTGMSQAEMAETMGVSKRTLQDWEQGRRQPTMAARVLIQVARLHPNVVREAAAAFVASRTAASAKPTQTAKPVRNSKGRSSR
ncbi:MAG TPA: helix-turn-helix domain-containing protein [Gemmatimonadales bacterium]|jgi:putative transcriptional regulator